MHEFHISVVLTVTTGVVFVEGEKEPLYDLFEYMTGERPNTLQWQRFKDECAPWIFRQHPELKTVDASGVNTENWRAFLNEQVTRFGEYLAVEPIPADDHARRNSLHEVVEAVGPNAKFENPDVLLN